MTTDTPAPADAPTEQDQRGRSVSNQIDPASLTPILFANQVDLSQMGNIVVLDFGLIDPAYVLNRVPEGTVGLTKLVARVALTPDVVASMLQGLIRSLNNLGLAEIEIVPSHTGESEVQDD